MKISVLFVLFILLLAILSCNYTSKGILAHSEPYANKFADRIDEGSGHLRSTYNTSWERTADSLFIYKQYYLPGKALTDLETYTRPERNEQFLHGRQIRWYDDGTLWQERYYEQGERTGLWKEYYDGSGALKEESTYDAEAAAYRYTGYTEEGARLKEYYRKEGLLHGPYRAYDAGGNVVAERQYREGELLSETVYQEGQVQLMADAFPVDRPAAFFGPDCQTLSDEEFKRCSDKAMLMRIYQGIRYPPDARDNGVQGNALLRFRLGADGSMTDIRVVHGLTASITRECLEAAERLRGDWLPAVHQGQDVATTFNLPIRFTIVRQQ